MTEITLLDLPFDIIEYIQKNSNDTFDKLSLSIAIRNERLTTQLIDKLDNITEILDLLKKSIINDSFYIFKIIDKKYHNLLINYYYGFLRFAVIYERINILDYIIEKYNIDINTLILIHSGQIFCDIGRSGKLNSLIYIISKFINNSELSLINYIYYTFHAACDYNRSNIVKYISEKYYTNRMLICTSDYYNLRILCKNSDINTVSYVLDKFNITREEITVKNNQCIQWLSSKGNLEMIRYLVERYNLDLNDIKLNHNIALRNACVNGYLDIVKYFVETFNITSEDLRLMICYDDLLIDIKIYLYLISKFGINSFDYTKIKNMNDMILISIL